MSAPVVLDIETQFLFQEVNHDLKKLKVSVVGLFDYATDQYRAYEEHELKELFRVLEHASTIIGFNIISFDLPVLAPYYVGNITQFSTFDLLVEVEKSLGFRLALNDLAKASLGTQKSGHGFKAIEYFRSGQMDKLKLYCLNDVKITKELYEMGKKEGKLYFLDRFGKREIKVKFDAEKIGKQSVSLSLPF
jgi:hypothetical protein